MFKQFIIIVTLFFLSASYAFAKEGLSLRESLKLAYFNHPEMRQVQEEIKASEGRRFQAKALPDPEFEIEIGGFKERNGSHKGDIGSFSFKQPLEPLGTRYLSGKIAENDVLIAENEAHLIWGKVREKIIDLYASILALEKSKEIAEDNLDITRKFYAAVNIRYQSGKTLKSDVIRSKIEVSGAENDFLTLEKDLKILKSKFNLALGREINQPVHLIDALSYEATQLHYEKLREHALLQRADLKQEEVTLSSHKNNVRRSFLKTIFPKMAIGIQRTTEDYENDTAILLEASYPLWGFNRGEIKEAKAEKRKQELTLATLKNQIDLEVYTAFLEVEAANKQVGINQDSLEESDELLRQASTQYQEGEMSFITYLENVKTVKKTRLAYLEALKNYKVRVAQLDRVIQNTPAPTSDALKEAL